MPQSGSCNFTPLGRARSIFPPRCRYPERGSGNDCFPSSRVRSRYGSKESGGRSAEIIDGIVLFAIASIVWLGFSVVRRDEPAPKDNADVLAKTDRRITEIEERFR